MHKMWACWVAAAVLSSSAMAQDIRDQWDVKISKAELVFPNSQPQEVAKGVQDAISQFAIPASLSYLPTASNTSAIPGAPVVKRLSAISQEYVCDGAYAEIKKDPPPVQNAFAFIKEGHHVCLYEFEKGVKAYVMYYNIKKLESLTSGLFNGITKVIRGSDEDRAKGQLLENIGWIREKLPLVLVERIEVTGSPIETPDAEAVAALIPKQVAQPVPAAVPAQLQAIAQPVATTPAQNKIEARKNLNAMGLTYHSQVQFFESIQRQDEVAVQLFLESGVVNAESKDSKGRTALQLAKSAGNASILALLEGHATLPAIQAAPAAVAPVNASSVPQVDESNVPPLLRKTAGVTSANYESLPEDMRKELDEELARLNLSPEDLLTARNNLAMQYVQARALTTMLNAGKQ